MNENPLSKRAPRPPAPPSPRTLRVLLWLRLIFAALALAAFVGVWAITGALYAPWRIALGLLVAAPFLLMPDLLREGIAAAPPAAPSTAPPARDEGD